MFFSWTVVSIRISFSYTSLESNRLILSFNIFCAPSSPMRCGSEQNHSDHMAPHIGSMSFRRSIASKGFQSIGQRKSHPQGYTSVSAAYCQPSFLLEQQVFLTPDKKQRTLFLLYPNLFSRPKVPVHDSYLSHSQAAFGRHSVADYLEFFLSFCKVFIEFTDYLADNQNILLTLIVNNQHVNYFLRTD